MLAKYDVQNHLSFTFIWNTSLEKLKLSFINYLIFMRCCSSRNWRLKKRVSLLFATFQNSKILNSQVLANLGDLHSTLFFSRPTRLKISPFPIFPSILQRGTINEFWHIWYTSNHWNYYFYWCLGQSDMTLVVFVISTVLCMTRYYRLTL